MYTHIGVIKRRWGNLLGEATHPIALYRCRDGYVSIVAVTQPQWEALCLAMELYDLLVDPALEVIGERFDRAAEIDAQIDAWLADRTVDEAVEHLQSRGVPASRLLTMAQVAREPQLDLRHFFATPPGWGDDARLPWVPFRLEGEAPEYSPAPAVGADTRAVLAGLASERAPLPAVDLASVRILEFGVAWAGPLAGRWLGDLGADVVKVEHPASRGAKPDRSFAEGWQWGTLPHPRVRYGVFPDGDPGERWWNRGGMFNKMNRSKRGVAVDAKTPAGERVLRGLIAASDVVLNNYSPRGAASLRIDAKGVRADNGRAITVSMSGYGADGPLAGNLSYGPVLQAHGGFDEATGYLGGPPQRIGVAYPDAVGGVHGAFAILAALWERARTDRPIDVDLSQLETLLSIAGEMLLAASVTGQGPVRHGNRAEGIAPQGVYPCAGDDEWVAVSVDRDEAWRALVDTIGDAALAPWRAASLAERTAAQDTLDERLAAWTRQRSARAVAGPLQAAGVVAVPVMTNQDLVDDEHLVERGFLVVLDQPDVGPKAFAGGGFHLSRTPLRLLHGPGLGEHNRAVLSEYLGTGEPELQELYATGVIADRPPAP
jgi:crotonobetainyl-CoA:carnitine CoA-transferase CaiB-like acyl-CoA transferase